MIKFDAIPGTTGKHNGSNMTFDLYGTPEAIDKVKKKLTVRNKSIGFQLKKAEDNIKFFADLLRKERDLYNGEVKDKTLNSYNYYENSVKELKDQLIQEYYVEHSNYLELPIGFWWLCETVENDWHLNTEIKPYHVDILRDYQKEAVSGLLKYKSSTAILFTGAGKSLVIASIVLSALKSGKRVFIVVPTEYLIGQVYDTIKKYHDDVTCYGGHWKKPNYGASVFICTANSAKNFISSYDVVLVDECQHLSSITWTDFMIAAEKAEYRYAFTGTGEGRGDGLDLAIYSMSGKPIINLPPAWGIQNGWLARPTFYLTNVDPGIKIGERSVAASAYKKLIQSKPVMDKLKAIILGALAKEHRIIVLFKTVNAGLTLRKLMKDDYQFNVASSKNKKPIDDFKSGKCNVLVSNSSLISEGLDIPDATMIVMVTQNSSEIITYQAIGRILRKSANKVDAHVIDITVKGFGQFEKAKQKRIDVYKLISNNIVEF